MNEIKWNEFTLTIFPVGQLAPVGSSLVCKSCKVPSICIATCGARIYYVFGTTNMTHACVHLGLYEHLIKASENQDIKEKTRTFIRD